MKERKLRNKAAIQMGTKRTRSNRAKRRGGVGCPAETTWQRFGSDGLTEEEAEQLASHIESCSACRRRVIDAEQAIAISTGGSLSTGPSASTGASSGGKPGSDGEFDVRLVERAVRDELQRLNGADDRSSLDADSTGASAARAEGAAFDVPHGLAEDTDARDDERRAGAVADEAASRSGASTAPFLQRVSGTAPWLRRRLVSDETLPFTTDLDTHRDPPCAGAAGSEPERGLPADRHTNDGSPSTVSTTSDVDVIREVRHGSGALSGDSTGEECPEAGRVIGGYRLIRLAGRGGMGEVFEAVTTDGFERRVAVKRLRNDGMDDVRIAALLREIEILSSIQHPQIVRVLDTGREPDGRPFLVTEFVDGLPIDQWCDQQQLDVDERVELFLDVCAGVVACHELAIVHRDLKPGNIFVDAAGRVKILDFGLARAIEPSSDLTQFESRTGMRVLTPAYASPEQLRGERLIGPATDVYSLGVVLHRLLCGMLPAIEANQHEDWKVTEHVPSALSAQRPIPPSVRINDLLRRSGRPNSVRRVMTRPRVTTKLAESELKATPAQQQSHQQQSAASADAAQIASRRRTTPDRLVRQLRGDLDRIILKSLDPQPGTRPGDGRRFGSVSDLSNQLSRYVEGQVVLPEERALIHRLRVALRSHWRLVSVVCLVFSMLTTALVVSLQLLQRTEAALNDTRIARARTLDTLEKYLDTLVADEVLAERRMRDLRQRLLTDSGNIYEEMLDSFETDAGLRQRIARGWDRLGVVHLETGSAAEAEAAFTVAIAQFRMSHSQETPKNKGHLRLEEAVALSRRSLARSRLGDHQNAETDSKAALSLISPDLQEPADTESVEVWETAMKSHWRVLYAQRKFAPALEIAQKLQESARRHFDRKPGADERRWLAEAISRTAITLHKAGQPTAALSLYATGLDLFGLTDEHIQNPAGLPEGQLTSDDMRIAAKLLSDRGMSLRALKHSTHALHSHLAAKELRQRLVNRSPLRLEDRFSLVSSLWNLSDTRFDFPDRDAEIAQWQECLKEIRVLLDFDRSDSRYREAHCIASTRLSQAFWNAGRRREAIDEFQRVIEEAFEPQTAESGNTAQQILVAGLYAQLSRRARTVTDKNSVHDRTVQRPSSAAILLTASECRQRALACLMRVRRDIRIRRHTFVPQLTDPGVMLEPFHSLPEFRSFLADVGADSADG
jgi:serine/threonine protein kinase/tetratricopeptide (TPR) repeat protein